MTRLSGCAGWSTWPCPRPAAAKQPGHIGRALNTASVPAGRRRCRAAAARRAGRRGCRTPPVAGQAAPASVRGNTQQPAVPRWPRPQSPRSAPTNIGRGGGRGRRIFAVASAPARAKNPRTCEFSRSMVGYEPMPAARRAPPIGWRRARAPRTMPCTSRGGLAASGAMGARSTCSVLSPSEQVSDQLLSLLIERLADEPTQSSSRAEPRSGACDNHGDGEPGGRGRREHHQPAPGAAALRIGRRHGLAAPEVPGDRSRNALPPQSGLA